jgi:hypothetical protein
MFISFLFVCCANSGLCDELILILEESYRLCCFELCVIWKPQTDAADLGC